MQRNQNLPLLLLVAAMAAGCNSIAQYGSPAGEQARVYRLGHTNKPPINAMLKLKQIDAHASVDQGPIAFNLAARKYDLLYKFVYITDAKIVTCSTGLGVCEEAMVNWLKHPYRISAQLKPGYVYMPVLRSETQVDSQICLYGEPLGTAGQRIIPVSDLLVLSPQAEKVACGSIDRSITYNTKD